RDGRWRVVARLVVRAHEAGGEGEDARARIARGLRVERGRVELPQVHEARLARAQRVDARVLELEVALHVGLEAQREARAHEADVARFGLEPQRLRGGR